MIRRLSFISAGLFTVAIALVGAPAARAQTAAAAPQGAQKASAEKAKTPAAKEAKNAKEVKKTSPSKPDSKPAAAGGGKPLLMATYGDWGAYTANPGKSKTCYALAQPKERQPASLKRDPGYLFISNRPAESVHNEVSFVMGFEVKPDSSPKAEIGATSFDMVAKGGNLWVKNAAEEGQFIDTLKKGKAQRLVIKAASKKGNISTDSYSLAGFAQAVDRAQKDCQ
jgi:hypothetical protein